MFKSTVNFLKKYFDVPEETFTDYMNFMIMNVMRLNFKVYRSQLLTLFNELFSAENVHLRLEFK